MHIIILTGHSLSLPDCQQSSLTAKAIKRLEMVFEIDQYPDIHTREQLAQQIGVS